MIRLIEHPWGCHCCWLIEVGLAVRLFVDLGRPVAAGFIDAGCWFCVLFSRSNPRPYGLRLTKDSPKFVALCQSKQHIVQSGLVLLLVVTKCAR